MMRIQGLEGMQYPRDGTSIQQLDYTFFNQQYATSTHIDDHNMRPALIIQPKSDEDIIATIKWATANNVAVAVKSGGHQYSGASSTGGKNIQLDLQNTYKDMMVLDAAPVGVMGATDGGGAFVYAGVSNRLMDFNAWLKHNQLFVPHGQCAYVCVGGHGQTGGYGQLGRSFGLFSDYIRSIRMIAFDGSIQNITKQSNPDLFYGILGGSPGNFGIITHYTIEVFQGKDYMGTVAGPNGFKGPHGIKGLWLYSSRVLKQLLTYLAKMSDDANFPRNYDLCVSVLSTDFPVTTLFPQLRDANLWDKIQTKVKNFLADEFLKWLDGKFPAIIVVYAQWVPLSKSDRYDAKVDAWFQQFRSLNSLFRDETLTVQELEQSMPDMTGNWIFPKAREFNLPYVKRTYTTNARNLSTNSWIDTVVSRLDLIYSPDNLLNGNPGEKNYERYLSCKLSVQIQNYGGNNAKFTTNKNNGTSFSWRDSSIVQTLDCFHNPDDDAKKYAEAWAAKNDALMNGSQGVFSKADRRVLWGSWGDWNLSDEKVWRCYYESADMYKKVGAVRAKADPNGTFTPNPFAVPAFKG